jgi:hypothetical protein
MTTMVTFDRPGFQAHILKEDGEIVCILAPAAAHDPAIQERVRELTHGQGIDCRTCCGCPVGTAK